jgi:hypothetical protein
MFIIIGFSILTVLVLIIAGLPIALWISKKLLHKDESNGPATLAIAILGGFALSAFSAATSYGILGIDFYPIIFTSLAIFTWLLVFLKLRNSIKTFLKDWKVSDLGLLVPILVSIYFSRNYWSNFSEPLMRAGDGPDTTQNLMAAQSARDLGNNWFSQANYFKQYVEVENLRDGVMQLYRLPSFREQAGIDYLVYGTRWGLTVPYSQVLRFFGNYAILWETGVILLTSLMALSIVIFATTKLVSIKPVIPMLSATAVISNTPFMVQYYNGGLSQAWAVASTSGFFLALAIFFKYPIATRLEAKRRFLILFVLVWLGVAVTYIDAAIVLVLFSLLLLLFLYIWERNQLKSLLPILVFSGILSALLVPIFSFATGYTFDYRLKAATGTGLPSQIWPLPSELMGLINIFTSEMEKRSQETLLLALLFTAYVIFKVGQGILRRSPTSWIAVLGLSGVITFAIGFILSITGRLSTNYIYLKVSTYVVPIVVIALFSLLDHSFNKSARLVKAKKSYFLILPSLIAGFVLFSGVSASNGLSKGGVSLPYGFKPLLQNADLQNELRAYNYLTPYLISANVLGVLGDVHWISKAPNDLILAKRIDLELRLICFNIDTTCTPQTKRISNPELEAYGLIVFESPLTTREFNSLTPKDRFDANFTVFGQTPQIIPSRFIGGNPYYND